MLIPVRFQRNWQEARTFCEEAGLELATINSDSEAEFLTSFNTFLGIYFRNIYFIY